jgi:hypothetical protein
MNLIIDEISLRIEGVIVDQKKKYIPDQIANQLRLIPNFDEGEKVQIFVS